jgi:uncharacterized membrane protein
MNREEFLKELEERLIGISKEDKKEILQDYEEHFKIGKKKKRSEEEIAKSLGEPKEIAKEIRKELSNKKDDDELKTDAIETWVAVKKFSIRMFEEAKEKAEEIYERFDSGNVFHWILLALGIIIFFTIIGAIGQGIVILLIIFGLVMIISKLIEKIPKRKIHKKERREKSLSKNIFIILFSIIFLIFIWVPLFFLIIGFLVGGVFMIISGIFLIVYSIFYFTNYDIDMLRNLFFSSLFAGIGLSFLGVLFLVFFDKIMQLFFRFTKKGFQLNRRFRK